MTAPTLTITISKSGGDLVLSGTLDSNDIGITSYTEPGRQRRTIYMPDSASVHGSEAVASALQQGLLSFDWVPDQATDESDVAASYDDVAAALDQFSYTVTVAISDADEKVWSADPGSIAPMQRDYTDLVNHNPVYTVTIPVYPIAGS